MTEQLPTDPPYLGVRLVVDNNFFPLDRSQERMELMALHKAGRIQLALVDVTGTEWLDAPPDVRAPLEAEAIELHGYHGPLVLDHSRLGHAVLGSEIDSQLLDDAASVTFPGTRLDQLSSRDLRDAMHIAKQYGFDFITSDTRLLRRARELQDRFNMNILSPAQALEFVSRLQRRADVRRADGREG